jgi:hypothetical protein
MDWTEDKNQVFIEDYHVAEARKFYPEFPGMETSK